MGKGSKKGGKGFQWGGFKGKGKGKQLEVKRSINIVRKVPEWQGSSSTEKAAIGKTRRQPRPDGGVTRVRNDDHVENPQDAVEKAKMAARRAKYGPVERTLPSLAFKGGKFTATDNSKRDALRAEIPAKRMKIDPNSKLHIDIFSGRFFGLKPDDDVAPTVLHVLPQEEPVLLEVL
eukprot:GEMP01049718.1.p1 GENE.GEMP01049718.1~~GEMP01049718.1.p1  ORF type:complete len:176 (+),score=29.47 GEMP01049718.1:39-566(+)